MVDYVVHLNFDLVSVKVSVDPDPTSLTGSNHEKECDYLAVLTVQQVCVEAKPPVQTQVKFQGGSLLGTVPLEMDTPLEKLGLPLAKEVHGECLSGGQVFHWEHLSLNT